MIIKKLKNYFFKPRFHFNRFQFNLIALFFITVGLVAGSYLTLKEILNIFAVDDTIKTWTFNSASDVGSSYTKSLVTIDDTGAHPTGGSVGANEFTNPSFATDNSSWTVTSTNMPDGWILVPGNSNIGTSDFLVMQYEARAYDTQTSAVVSAGGGSNNWAGNNGQTRYTAVSVGTDKPWGYIQQYSSTYFDIKEACNAITIGTTNAHLIKNNEWMTIARNIEQINSNWTGGTVGSGSVSIGNTGDISSSLVESSGVSKRTLNLSNGSTIWDIAGNVFERMDEVQTAGTVIWTSASVKQWNDASISSNARAMYGPSNIGYSSSQGMGTIYGGAVGNSIYRSRGLYGLGADIDQSYQNTNVGFRCVASGVSNTQSFSSDIGRSGGGNTVVGSLTDARLIQSVNVGDTSTYDFSVYVYDNTANEIGATITSNIASLYYNGSAVGTTYTDAGSGWWKLSGSVVGAGNTGVEVGILVEVGKTVKVDDFTLSKQGTYSVYTTTAYSNLGVSSWDSFCEGTLSGSICTPDATYTNNSNIKYQICTDDGTTCESTNAWQYWNGSTWATAGNSTTNTNTAAQLTTTVMRELPVTSQKISVKAIFNFGGSDVPLLPHISLGLTTDTAPPDTNASNLAMKRNSSGTNVGYTGWTNNLAPYFSWSLGTDSGSGLKGYCLYLGTSDSQDPRTSKGLLGTSPISRDKVCDFIINSTSIDFSTTAYRAGVGSSWLETSNDEYVLSIKAIDNADNTATNSAQFKFKFDNTAPKNVTYISCASGNFSDVNDMTFSWPTSVGSSASASDVNSGILGWQYQINSTDGEWKGSTNSTELGLKYIPSGTSSYNLGSSDTVIAGNNVIYFRSVDVAGNVSSDATIRTCSLSFGGAAPSFNPTDKVTVTPETSETNSFALSWPTATAGSEQGVTHSVAHYYYMINTPPPSTLTTLQGNPATYVDVGTSMSVPASALMGINKGANNIYVVAVDDVGNYSPSNFISGTFTLNSTNPDNVGSLAATDSSIKSSSQWNVTLVWTAPNNQGAGNLSYLIYRSTDGITFTQSGTSTGLSYVDNAPASRLYYYKIVTKDGVSALSSGTNGVSITPTGKWTSAPSLDSGPSVGSITTKKAVITWGTSRSSDSKVSYGLSSGSYFADEVGNSTQTGSHTVNLTNLKAGTTYYYKVKWTDEDGNTGISDEKTFTTAAAPTVKDVAAKNVGLSSAIVQFTSKDASKVKIYYGTSTSFGGAKEISTATNETTYTAELSGLLDGTKYYYKINTFDSDNSEYEGTTLDFSTLPRPKISGVKLEQVVNTAQSTIRVSWNTNTEVSSVITYYPVSDVSVSRDEIKIALEKGQHTMMLRGLSPETNYVLIVKGRDKLGNEAASDSQKFTTATDTRPPQILDFKIITGTIPPVGFVAGEIYSQLIITWNTDEPATSQVEFGQGTGTNYSQKTQEDGNLTTNHTVIISKLTPSQVYHLRVISKDKAGNETKGIDSVIITSKETKSALDLVVKNLSEAFNFINFIKQ